MPFKLLELPFAYDALQPHMSKETLEYHHDKHHKAYVETANKLIQGTGLEDKSVEEVVKATARDPSPYAPVQQCRPALESFPILAVHDAEGRQRKIPGEIETRLNADLGGLDKFKKDFVAQGVADFGSGWVWLVLDGGKFKILKTSNADNPLSLGKTMLLACDVWEHAYYIDYRNRREEFLKSFVDNLINWDYVAELYAHAADQKAAA